MATRFFILPPTDWKMGEKLHWRLCLRSEARCQSRVTANWWFIVPVDSGARFLVDLTKVLWVERS